MFLADVEMRPVQVLIDVVAWGYISAIGHRQGLFWTSPPINWKGQASWS